MSITHTPNTPVHVDGTLVGWYSRGGCENPACRAATAAGRPWHATPSGFAVTMPDYHFATADAARDALVATYALHGAPQPPSRGGRRACCDRTGPEPCGPECSYPDADLRALFDEQVQVVVELTTMSRTYLGDDGWGDLMSATVIAAELAPLAYENDRVGFAAWMDLNGEHLLDRYSCEGIAQGLLDLAGPWDES